MSKYVIFNEIEEQLLDGTVREGLMFIAAGDDQARPTETAFRGRAAEYDTPRAAYEAAGRYPHLADWRVGAR